MITKRQFFVFLCFLEGITSPEGVVVTAQVILVLLALGGVGGWYLGRSWAEDARAEYDMQKIWKARHNYRKKSGSSKSGSNSDL